MKKDIDVQFLCKNCERYNLCSYYHNRKEDSYICKNFHLPNKLDKIRAEIETKYGRCKLTEYIVQYDGICTGRNEIGDIADILQIIDKYKAESEK